MKDLNSGLGIILASAAFLQGYGITTLKNKDYYSSKFPVKPDEILSVKCKFNDLYRHYGIDKKKLWLPIRTSKGRVVKGLKGNQS